jgi:hypothetical protein
MNTKRSWLRAGPLALLLAASLTSPVRGQSVTASVTGVVEDNTGGIMKGASVTAVSQKTGVEHPTKSNDAGVYTITGLPIGEYKIKAEAQGFKSAVTNAFTLETNQIARVNLKLELGTVNEELQVVGINPVLQTENAVVGEVISGTTATALPLNGRNFAQLTLLVPGVVAPKPDSFIAPKTGDDGGRPFVNGQREQGNNFMLDGLDQNEAMDNLVAYYPSPDSLAEIRVETNNYSAEFGNVAGAIVSAVTKSGTNEFHGNVFEFFRDDKFDANSWGNNKNSTPSSPVEKAALNQHIFGATLGGPLVKNKVFFFADYQGTRRDEPGGATATVAPAAWRLGDLSSVSTPIIDPNTGVAFPGNRIPVSRFSPQARALFGDTTNYPLPTDNSKLNGNYASTQEKSTRNHQGDVKVDANLSPNDNLALRISIGDYDTAQTKTPLPLALGSQYASKAESAAASWSRTFSPTLVNELRFGYSHNTIDDARNGSGLDWAGIGNYNATIGIPGTQRVPGMSGINWESSGLSNIGSAAAISDSDNRTLQLAEKLSISKGSHFLSVGAQVLHTTSERFYAGNEGSLGSFTYSGDVTGHAFADFLLDKVTRKGIGGGAEGDPWQQSSNRIGVFIQDDFKASSKLTLNIGVRWEYTSPLVEKNDRQVNVDINTGEIIEPGGRLGRGLYESYYGGFAPRVGFAWTPNDATVIRGGYGIVQFMEGTGANTRLTMNPPFFTERTTAYPKAAPGTIATGFADLGEGTGSPRAYQQDLRPQFTQQRNLFIERRVSDGMSLSAGYVGSSSSHLVAFRGMNQELAGTGPASTWGSQQRKPLPQFGLIRYTASDAEANYNALQVSLRQRRTKGLEFLASYTFSKTLTDNQGFYGPGWGGGETGFTHFNQGIGDGNQDSYHPEADYGPALFDATHVASVAANYELPFGKGRANGSDWSGVSQALLGGWNVSSIVSVRSGFPITVSQGWGGSSLQGNFAYQRPDRVGEGQGQSFDWANQANPSNRWLDVNAFRDAQLGTFGNAGVGILRGPGFWNVDVGLDKDFGLGGSRFLTLRIEAFNALNHANKGMPVRDFSNKDQFGQILTVANSARVLEFAAKLRF